MIERTLLWTPKTKDRPRSGRGRTYTPAATVRAEQDLARQWEHDPLEGPVGVRLSMWNDRIDVQVYPSKDYTQRRLRGDIDNYEKLILDALNGHAWLDDRQIVELACRKM